MVPSSMKQSELEALENVLLSKPTPGYISFKVTSLKMLHTVPPAGDQIFNAKGYERHFSFNTPQSP